jgi:uncharacterized membrane protein
LICSVAGIAASLTALSESNFSLVSNGRASFASGDGHAFLLDQGSYTTLDVPGAYTTQATGINASGHIVGYYMDANGTHGFLATPVP